MISPASSVAFHLGSYSVKFYSITMFFAIICGIALSCFIAKKFYKEVNIEKFLDMLTLGVVCALIGARLYYVIFDWAFYSSHLGEIFAVYHGGLSIHGAILGGFLGCFFYAKKHLMNFWKYADICSYGLLLGQIIGRLGNFFNIEAFGKPCSFSDAVCLFVPESKRPFEFLDISYYHPTFMYEMVWNFFVLLILFFVARKFVKNYDGVLFFVYLILYSIGRLFIEHLRLDSVFNVGALHIAEIASVFVIVISLIMIFIRIKKTPKNS